MTTLNRIFRYITVATSLITSSIASAYDQIGDTGSVYTREYFFNTALPQWADNANVQYILYMTSDLSRCSICKAFNNAVISTSAWKDYATSSKIGVYEGARNNSRLPGDGRTNLPIVSLFRKPTDVSAAGQSDWQKSFRKNYLVADIPMSYIQGSGRERFTGYLTTVIANDKATHGTIDVSPGATTNSASGSGVPVVEHGWNVLSISGEDSYTREGTRYVFDITRSGDAKEALTLIVLVDGDYYADVRWNVGEFGAKQVAIDVPTTDKYDDGDNIVVSIKSLNRYIRLKH